ncbi:MAG: HupE/UreJ family protein [Gammaproteobacteria bacterium]|nr:HupE/UreJ family protein [Gammaproteobacteria bacterium]
MKSPAPARQSSRLISRLNRSLMPSLGVMVLLMVTAQALAHDIPSRVSVNIFVKPEGSQLSALLRVPMDAFGEIVFPVRGPGYLRFSDADDALQDAARVYITESLHFYENGIELTEKELMATRVSLPSSRAFVDYESALENVLSPPLEDTVNLYYRQGMLDVLVTYPIQSEDSDFSVNPELGTLSDETTTVLRFLLPNGAERAFNYAGNPGLVELDPRWYQAGLRFVGMGFDHILEGIDHLLFLFCLVVPLRRLRALIPVITSFTTAHSITLISSAFGMAPNVLWFPPLIETLIALSIVYMAFENIVGAKTEHRWMVTFGFGLVHGFGFSFLFSETLQFAGGHLFSSLLAFNIGVELGQILVLILVIPVLNILFKYLIDEKVGGILLSALLAHSAWHWMLDRGAQLFQYQYQWPVVDALFLSALIRWGMLLIVIATVLWVMYELFRRLSLIESFSGYRSEQNQPVRG